MPFTGCPAAHSSFCFARACKLSSIFVVRVPGEHNLYEHPTGCDNEPLTCDDAEIPGFLFLHPFPSLRGELTPLRSAQHECVPALFTDYHLVNGSIDCT